MNSELPSRYTQLPTLVGIEAALAGAPACSIKCGSHCKDVTEYPWRKQGTGLFQWTNGCNWGFWIYMLGPFWILLRSQPTDHQLAVNVRVHLNVEPVAPSAKLSHLSQGNQ